MLKQLFRIWLLTAFLGLSATVALAQDGTLRGRVTDAGGEPLAGAGLVVKGTENGFIT